jgi:hypothetical protein
MPLPGIMRPALCWSRQAPSVRAETAMRARGKVRYDMAGVSLKVSSYLRWFVSGAVTGEGL